MQIPDAAAWDRVEGDHLSDIPWKQLCEAIMKEQDPQKLLALVDELNQELERQTNLLPDIANIPFKQSGIGVR
jgi:hypothetical protein